MTKTLNQVIVFSSTKIKIFFQQHWESENIVRKKTIAHPLKVKCSVPYQFLNLIETDQNHSKNHILISNLLKKKNPSHFSLIAAIYFASVLWRPEHGGEIRKNIEKKL
jgi:hypothetical protein